MPYYTASTTTSSSTYIYYPQWTATGSTITITQAWNGGIVLPSWNTTTGGYVLEPGLQWGWHPENQPRSLQEAYQPPSSGELDRIMAGERARTQERRARRARITERAEALLSGLLDEEQIRSYFGQGWFEVTGSSGGRYRINRNGQAGNIDELAPRGDERVASLCIHPYGGFHDADAHAAQYLALVTDEESFRRTANRTPRRRLAAA
jgi:hypothetical protein